MTEHLSFDAGPDPELGAALRAALDAGNDAAFVARVEAALTAAPARWEVLGGAWSRPALAAAIALIALAGLWLGAQPLPNGTPDETIAAATPGTVAALLAADRPPSMDVMLGAAQPH